MNNETNKNKIVNKSKKLFLYFVINRLKSLMQLRLIQSLYLIKKVNPRLSRNYLSKFYNNYKDTKCKNNLCGIVTDIIFNFKILIFLMIL